MGRRIVDAWLHLAEKAILQASQHLGVRQPHDFDGKAARIESAAQLDFLEGFSFILCQGQGQVCHILLYLLI